MKQLYEFLINSRSTGVIKINFEFVDLGLTSGNLWATCNLGAKNPEDIGDYYQWAGLTPVNEDQASWDNCPYYNRNKKCMTKYNKKEQLNLEDDIAYKLTNGLGRIPSYDDSLELYKETNSTRLSNDCVKYTSKKDESKFILVPKAGIMWDGNLDTYYTCFWTSTVCDFTEQGAFSFSTDSGLARRRCDGIQIRPIKVK